MQPPEAVGLAIFEVSILFENKPMSIFRDFGSISDSENFFAGLPGNCPSHCAREIHRTAQRWQESYLRRSAAYQYGVHYEMLPGIAETSYHRGNGSMLQLGEVAGE
jgi:hypothetical protein